MDRAAVALEAKSDEKWVPDKKSVVGTKGKKAVGIKKLTKSLVGKKNKGCSDQEISSWKEVHRKETHHRGKEGCCINLNLFIL